MLAVPGLNSIRTVSLSSEAARVEGCLVWAGGSSIRFAGSLLDTTLLHFIMIPPSNKYQKLSQDSPQQGTSLGWPDCRAQEASNPKPSRVVQDYPRP